MEPGDLVEHLTRTARWTASRSSGPGGQHRDKASTRAELTLTSDSLADLEPALASRLMLALRLNERPLRIIVQEERSLSRNQEIAVERLRKLVTEALSPPPPRRPTRPSRGSRERRLADKARRGLSKDRRRPPDED
jgi:ribosome-associated protein